MKKSVLYTILVIVLVTIAVIFYLHDEKSTLLPGSSAFALNETEKVDSIFLQQDSLQVTLVRKTGKWSLDGVIPVREKAITHFFNVLSGLQVEAPATKEKREEIIDLVHQNPVRVKIYSNGNVIKNYLVEDSKYKKGTTYMMMKDKSTPFLISIPGFEGDIANLYNVEPSYWRDRAIFSYSAIDISSVKVIYSSGSKTSFKLNYRDEGFRLIDLNQSRELKSVRNDRASRYYSYFSDIRYEQIFSNQRLLDSLKQGEPFCKIAVKDKNDNQLTLETYRKPSSGQKDAFGQKSTYDLNHMYGIYSKFDKILLIKYTEIDPLFKEIDYFRVD